MTHVQLQTLVVVGAVVALLGIFDVWLVVVRGRQATISYSLYHFAQRYPIVPFLVGVLMGHFFWGQ